MDISTICAFAHACASARVHVVCDLQDCGFDSVGVDVVRRFDEGEELVVTVSSSRLQGLFSLLRVTVFAPSRESASLCVGDM